eukprot:TRINITY_DN16600_c0_g1_i1.p1 TRINITY_DN16600_c0_g1~~TRINITY_DN16600_c0_g1_i1.p1  ORF type:complete len:114 (-),score=13.93 TRINITY_DN16600_c0_g1_i1:76-417(-)
MYMFYQFFQSTIQNDVNLVNASMVQVEEHELVEEILGKPLHSYGLPAARRRSRYDYKKHTEDNIEYETLQYNIEGPRAKAEVFVQRMKKPGRRHRIQLFRSSVLQKVRPIFNN